MTPIDKLKAPRRVIFLDEARGLFLLIMIAYHALYDLWSIFGVRIGWWQSPFLHRIVQPLVAGGFILIAGIASRYSRSNLRRGLLTLGTGLAVFAFTAALMPAQIVMFGVLHLLGACMLGYHLLAPLFLVKNSAHALLGIAACILLCLATRHIGEGYLGLGGLRLYLPQELYRSGFLFPLGICRPDFYSSDYFPLLPWAFVFFAGSFLGTFFVSGAAPEFFYRSHCRPLAQIGRRSLLIYVLHQPITYGLLWLWFRISAL